MLPRSCATIHPVQLLVTGAPLHGPTRSMISAKKAIPIFAQLGDLHIYLCGRARLPVELGLLFKSTKCAVDQEIYSFLLADFNHPQGLFFVPPELNLQTVSMPYYPPQ